MATDVTFLVRIDYARYHHSTDAYLGMGSRIEDAFGTYEEAMQYIARNYIPHEDFDDEFYAYITMMVSTDTEEGTFIKEHSMRDLHVNSYYTGPAFDNWSTIPF